MKPVILIVLDGWGLSDYPTYDATAKADIPFYRKLMLDYPHTVLETSGESVGLPEGQMGNSEVGHLNLGAGRVVYQDYVKINKAIKDGSFFENAVLNTAMDTSILKNGALHLLGLVSDGGVHSHINHLFALIELALRKGVDRIFIHAFMDGRDTPPRSGLRYIRQLEEFLRDKPSAHIATVTGRYWAMDRDRQWQRVEKAYRALLYGEGIKADSAGEAVEKSYSRNETDEFIKPSVIFNGNEPVGRIEDNDAVIFFNFRADRAREITMALTDDDFTGFERFTSPKVSAYVTMTLYDERFSFPVVFPPVRLTGILGEVLSDHNMKQLRIAETEKYAHVTYFFNGGEEKPFSGEDRCLIPSPREVATYDLKPEMSAYEVTEEVIRRIEERKYGFILLNYANPDMVGHTGVMDAAVKACEAIDRCLEKVCAKATLCGGTVMITADHGNCEKMSDNGSSHTAHTTNLVPFILVKKDMKLRRRGILADVAPTVLDLLNVEIPKEMTGESLIRS